MLPAKKGTLGGAFCSGKYPGFYAHVIGVEAILPDGSYIRYGGKLMKNAGGYPLTRLFAGSQGFFGLVTQLTFKVFPKISNPLVPHRFQKMVSDEVFARLRRTLDTGKLIVNPEGQHD